MSKRGHPGKRNPHRNVEHSALSMLKPTRARIPEVDLPTGLAVEGDAFLALEREGDREHVSQHERYKRRVTLAHVSILDPKGRSGPSGRS